MDPWLQFGTSVVGGLLGSSKSATPAMSASNPMQTGLFDDSGWIVNFSGTQNATSSPSNTASPASYPSQAGIGMPGGIDGNALLLIGGAALVLMLWR